MASRSCRTLLTAALAMALSVPVLAQDAPPVLRVDAGTVMTSSGGEFISSPGGEPVPAGDRVMLAEGGRATMLYPNGCTQPLETAGVYTVSPTCVPVVGARGPSPGTLVIGGVVALGAIAALSGGGGGDNAPPAPPPPPPPPPPVSR